MKYSIQRRLLVWLITFTLSICSLSSIIIYYETHSEVGKLFDAQLEQLAKILLNMSAHELYEQLEYNEHINTENNQLPQIFSIGENIYEQRIDYQVWLTGGILAVRSNNAPEYRLTKHEKIFSDLVLDDGKKRRVYAISNIDNSIQVQIMAEYVDRDKLTNTIATHYMTSLAIILPIIALIIYYSVGRAMAPLRRIANDIDNKKPDDLQPIPSGAVPIEVDKIISALNHLFDRLNKAFENIRRFTSDAAHEIRTPLAIIQVHSELAIKAKDRRSRVEAMNEITDEINQISILVEQLLILSRLDPDGSFLKSEKLDLTKMAEYIIANQAPEAFKKNLEISLNAQASFIISAKLGLIPILMRNLIENAINYTPDNGKVEIVILQTDNHILLIVDDSGPGIPDMDQKRVFERFYRCRESNVSGYGLGLSIVKRIIELHDATIALHKSTHGGLRVLVEFPH